MFLSFIDRAAISQVAPAIGRDLRLTPVQMGLVFSGADLTGDYLTSDLQSLPEQLQSIADSAALAAAEAEIVRADRIALNPDCGFAEFG